VDLIRHFHRALSIDANECNGELSLVDAHHFARFGTWQDNLHNLGYALQYTYEEKWEQSGKRLSCIRYEGGWLGRNEMGVSVGNACDCRVARLRALLSLLQYLAIDYQYGHNRRHIFGGVSNPEHTKP